MARPNTRSATAAASPTTKRKAQDEPSDKPIAKKKTKSTTTKTSSTSSQDFPQDLEAKEPHARAPKNANQPSTSTKKAQQPAPTTTTTTTITDVDSSPSQTGPNYYLMKAEPNTRLENDIDVKFSIDDLRACTTPEPWEGVRNYVARNNMMAMKKGELAFFYHSNCKVPGIAGVMEVVEESCVDESAFDSKHPYYDAKSNKEKPRWFMVHVGFVRKFEEMVTLKQLQALGGAGTPLENMQLLKQSRLSVSKVSKEEWDYIMEIVEERETATKEKD